jgi:hypothetical protein
MRLKNEHDISSNSLAIAWHLFGDFGDYENISKAKIDVS